MAMFKGVFDDLSKGKSTEKQLKASLEAVQGKLDSAASMSEDAAKEPRFWRQPWRPSLCSTITTGLSQLVKHLRILVKLTLENHSEASDLKELLDSLPAY